MCGRYSRKAEKEDVLKHFELVDGLAYFDNYKASNEVFPGTPILVINNQHLAEDVHWTIRDKTWDGKLISTVNAKAENVTRTPMFKDAFANDRVLIPATSLFEWQVQPDNSKIKFKIWFDEPIFAFGGIARDCEIKGETIRCGVIMTTYPNDIFKEIHNTKQRQAVVIRQQDYERWLNPKTKVEDLKSLLMPLPNEETHFSKD